MSWLFSQALVEEYSAGTSLAGQPCAQLNVMPTPHKFWRNDKMIEPSDHSRFGLTSQLLMESHGMELLMSYLAASPAKTSVAPAAAPGLMANAVDYGGKCGASLARYDPGSSTWKTAQCSLLGDSDEFLETWPRWGSMRNGGLFQRAIPALPTNEKEYGSWATPQARDFRSGSASRWDDPRRSRNLNDQVAKWPTPQASNNRDRGNLSTPAIARRVEKGKQVMLSMCVSEKNGRLNPRWVEWLMGWPIGWTSLKPLEMDKFQEWQQQHSIFCDRNIDLDQPGVCQ